MFEAYSSIMILQSPEGSKCKLALPLHQRRINHLAGFASRLFQGCSSMQSSSQCCIAHYWIATTSTLYTGDLNYLLLECEECWYCAAKNCQHFIQLFPAIGRTTCVYPWQPRTSSVCLAFTCRIVSPLPLFLIAFIVIESEKAIFQTHSCIASNDLVSYVFAKQY